MEILCFAIRAYMVILFVRILLSWIPISPTGGMAQVARLVYDLTEPALAPLRRIVPPAGMFDLSVLVLWIILMVIQGQVCSA